MKFNEGKLIEATIAELRAIWLNDESLHEVLEFEIYVKCMRNYGCKIIEEEK